MFMAGSEVCAAYQYNWKGNQGWLSFDGTTTISFEVESTTLKDKKDPKEISPAIDYGWYNLDQKNEPAGGYGSFKTDGAATFNEGDKIGLWVKTQAGDVFTSTKDGVPKGFWGHAEKDDPSLGGYVVYNTNNSGHVAYIFRDGITVASDTEQGPSGQPLPGILAALLVGGAVLFCMKKHKKREA